MRLKSVMTPEVRAKELVEKFDSLLPCQGTTTGQTPIDCALILVDEILILADIADSNMNGVLKKMYSKEDWSSVLYWNKVKEELMKM